MSARPRWERFGGSGPPLLFAHANGFPPGCYRRLLRALAEEHTVIAALHAPLWSNEPAPRVAPWGRFAADLLDTLDALALPEPVVAVGHSLGGTTLALAAARAPERFAALALLDPVLIRPAHTVIYNLGTWLLPRKRALLRATRRRRDHWPDRAAAFANLRDKGLFRGVDDEGLRDCVDAMVEEAPPGGVRLRFPKAWEAAIFARGPWAWGALAALTRRGPPLLAVRATRSNLLLDPVWRHWRSVSPGATFAELPGSHLVPIEAPDATAATVGAFLAQLRRG